MGSGGEPAADFAQGVSRRVFLRFLGGTVAAVAAGCVPGSTSTTVSTSITVAGTSSTTVGTALAEPSDVWGIWREALAAVRTSPDHLGARAARLVATRDPEAIFRFVRDEIVTFPPQRDGFEHAVTEMRWGVEATLRCGAGTPREQAELLAALLTQAGISTEVVQGRLDAAVDRRLLLRPNATRPFEPEIDEARLERWLRVLESDESPPNDIDPGGADSRPIADLLIAELPAGTSAPGFDWTVDSVPLVRAEVGGQEVLLNPLVPDAAFGEPHADDVASSGPPSAPPNIEVELRVSTTLHPETMTTVAAGSWPVGRLVGRQLVARFVPAGEPASSFHVPAIQITTFTPALAVEGPGLSPGDVIEDAVLGDSVTVSGVIVRESQDGGVTVDDEPLGVSPDPVTTDVASLDVAVDSSAFPLIRLRVKPANAEGEPVVGLPGNAFVVEEDDVAVSFFLRQASPPPPKVLLLFDASKSVPDEFQGVGATPFGRLVAERVLAAFPDARFRVAGVTYGVATASPQWTSDPAEVETETGRVIGEGSELWSAIAGAGSFGPNVIVLISDGQATDPPETLPGFKAQVAVGPPVVVIGVGDVDAVGVADIVQTTGGAAYPVASSDAAADAVVAYLQDRNQSPSHIQYQAMEEGPSTRTVRVRSSGVETTGEYDVPDVAERVAPPGLAGIYLVVRVRGREAVHTVAGIPVDQAEVGVALAPSAASDVRSALFGVTRLSVEASAPTIAAWLDDLFTSRLSLQPLAQAPDGAEGLMEAFDHGVHRFASELPALHAPAFGDGDALTFETGPRLVVISGRPLLDGGTIRTSDVLRQTASVTAADDPVEAMRATVRNSVRLAVAEAALFDDSTIARLDGRELAVIPAGIPAPRDGPFAAYAKLLDRWSSHHRLMPADDGPFAFWAIDTAGSVVGVLPDGSGGGITSDPNAACKTINQGAAWWDLFGAAAGFPFAYGAFFSLQRAIMKQTLREAAIIASIGGPEPDTSECGNGPSDVLCDWGKDALTEMFKPLTPLSLLDKFAEAGTGGGVFNC